MSKSNNIDSIKVKKSKIRKKRIKKSSKDSIVNSSTKEIKFQDMINDVTLGESEELIKLIPNNSVDLVITDPPYLMDAERKNNRGTTIHSLQKFDDKEFLALCNGFDIDFFLGEFQRVLKKVNMFIFCSNKQVSSLMKWGEDRGYIVNLLVWHKYNATPFSNGVYKADVEFIVHIREGGSIFKGKSTIKNKVFKIPSVVSKYGHPTEKPVFFYQRFIDLCANDGDLILDPFAGSGTLAEACNHHKNIKNLKFILFEKSEKYYKVCKERIKGTSKDWSSFFK